MLRSFQNLIARRVWPRINAPSFLIESQNVIQVNRPGYIQVNVIARLHGQIPADQCAWLVEGVKVKETDRFMAYHPKRALSFSLARQRESYLSSGSSMIQRCPMVIIVPRLMEQDFWQTLSNGRKTGIYSPHPLLRTSVGCTGATYTT